MIKKQPASPLLQGKETGSKNLAVPLFLPPAGDHSACICTYAITGVTVCSYWSKKAFVAELRGEPHILPSPTFTNRRLSGSVPYAPVLINTLKSKNIWLIISLLVTFVKWIFQKKPVFPHKKSYISGNLLAIPSKREIPVRSTDHTGMFSPKIKVSGPCRPPASASHRSYT